MNFCKSAEAAIVLPVTISFFAGTDKKSISTTIPHAVLNSIKPCRLAAGLVLKLIGFSFFNLKDLVAIKPNKFSYSFCF